MSRRHGRISGLKKTVEIGGRDWLPVEDVMRTLGKSERSIQRLAAAGHLRWTFQHGSRMRLYHAGDVERVLEGGIQTERLPAREPGAVHEAQMAGPAVMAVTTTPVALSSETSSFFERLVEKIAAPRGVGVTDKLWLTLEEAVAYSGLSVAAILAGIAEEKIVSGNLGRHGRRVVRRASLEAYRG
jgi:hypothetical protein